MFSYPPFSVATAIICGGSYSIRTHIERRWPHQLMIGVHTHLYGRYNLTRTTPVPAVIQIPKSGARPGSSSRQRKAAPARVSVPKARVAEGQVHVSAVRSAWTANSDWPLAVPIALTGNEFAMQINAHVLGCSGM